MHGLDESQLPKVMVVDDEDAVRGLLVRWLRDEGYQCLQAANPQDAWAKLQTEEVGLVTLDISMPGGSGLDLLKQIRDAFPDTSVIMLTGHGNISSAIKSLTAGACGYLTKPADREELLFHVNRALERRHLLIDKRNYTMQLEQRVLEQTREVRQAYEDIVHRLVSASRHRDDETCGHVKRVGLLSELLAREVGWDSASAELLRLAAPMHDIGKLAIPDAILSKPGRLDPDEFELMKEHTTRGAQILAGSNSPVVKMAHEIALSHHEKWNGSGYPRGLAGDKIPQSARIVAIVDVYDALTNRRVYRPAITEPQAVSMMLEASGSQFDPELLERFMSLLPEVRRICEAHAEPAKNESTSESTSARTAVEQIAARG